MNINYENVEIRVGEKGKWSPWYDGEKLYDSETKKPVYKGIPVLFTNVPDDAKQWFKDNSVEAQGNNQTDEDENSSFLPKNNQDADETKQVNDALNKLLDNENQATNQTDNQTDNQTNNQTNKPEKSTADKTKELKDNVDKLEADLVKIEADEKAELKAVRDRFRKKKNNKKADIEKAKNIFTEYVFVNNPDIKEQVDKLLNG